MQQFLWTDDWGQTQKLAFEHFENKAELIRNYAFEPSEGVIQWLDLLKEYEVPCCFASGADFDKAAAEQIKQTQNSRKAGVEAADDDAPLGVEMQRSLSKRLHAENPDGFGRPGE